ncbi:hypothetical protein GOBAR_DD26363 [Gossypium barbadense]|nr:hypothetical protein GOBAR_DD26363 [Gossypium barbadense]
MSGHFTHRRPIFQGSSNLHSSGFSAVVAHHCWNPFYLQKIIVFTGDNNLRIDTNASWKRKIDGEENVVLTKNRKKIQYGRLAQFKGM